MARFDRAKAVEQAGGQFELIMLAAKRGKDLQRGAKPLTPNVGNSEAVTALHEIEEGAIGPEYMDVDPFDPHLQS